MSKEQRHGARHGAMQVPSGSECCFAFCRACQPSTSWDMSASVSVRFGELAACTPLHGHGPHRSRVLGCTPGAGAKCRRSSRCVLSAFSWSNENSGPPLILPHTRQDLRAEGMKLSWNHGSVAHVLTWPDSCIRRARKLLSVNSSFCSFAMCIAAASPCLPVLP